MNSGLQRVVLDDRGRDYLGAQLNGAGEIGNLVSKHAPWVSGDVWTWLPNGVELDRLYRFTEPELLPINAKARLERTSNMVPVTSLRSDLVELLASCLQHAGPHASCVIEHPMLKPGEGPDYVREMSVSFGNTVLFPLAKTASTDQIRCAVDISFAPWRFIGFVCDPVTPLDWSSPSLSEDLADMLDSTALIFSVAYDGESFVMFEKGSRAAA